MADNLSLSVQARSDIGKGASRRLRRNANHIPAILYGAGKDSLSLQIDHNKVIKALENEAFYSSILTLDVDGKKEQAVLKAVQRHESKPKILHMDFMRITGKEEITMLVPLHFIGEDLAPGIKQGGIIAKAITEVEVKCLPKDLPKNIEVDISELELDHSIHLSSLVIPKGVNLTIDASDSDHDRAVVSINTPKRVIEEEIAPAEEEGAEGAEGAEGEAADAKKEEE